MATAPHITSVTFWSDKPKLKLLRKSAEERLLPNGNVVVTAPELAYEFVNGELTLDVGRDMLDDGPEGEQDAIDYIRRQIATTEVGQWVIEVEPVAPDPGPVYQAIGKAQAEKDIDALTEIGNVEYATWNRDPVMDAVRAALVELQGPVPEPQEA